MDGAGDPLHSWRGIRVASGDPTRIGGAFRSLTLASSRATDAIAVSDDPRVSVPVTCALYRVVRAPCAWAVRLRSRPLRGRLTRRVFIGPVGPRRGDAGDLTAGRAAYKEYLSWWKDADPGHRGRARGQHRTREAGREVNPGAVGRRRWRSRCPTSPAAGEPGGARAQRAYRRIPVRSISRENPRGSESSTTRCGSMRTSTAPRSR